MKKLLVALGIAALIAVPSGAAIAAGSDGPTPYSVTVEGIQLPAGETFKDGGHVNVKSNQGNRGIHFESLNNQPSGKWIGKSFIPWAAFGYKPGKLCVEWVQLSQYNEHFGEGGQQPVGKGCAPCPTVSPTPSPTPTPTSSPTSTPSPTPTVTPGPTVTVTPSPTPTPTTTPSPTPTVTPTPTSTPTPSTTPSPTSTPSTTPSPVVTPTTTPTATSYPVPTPDSTLPSSSARLATTGATPEDVGIQAMLVGGALLALIGMFLLVNVYKR